jgi:hypothetical protein
MAVISFLAIGATRARTSAPTMIAGQPSKTIAQSAFTLWTTFGLVPFASASSVEQSGSPPSRW